MQEAHGRCTGIEAEVASAVASTRPYLASGMQRPGVECGVAEDTADNSARMKTSLGRGGSAAGQIGGDQDGGSR